MLNELALFAGIGGGILGGKLAGRKIVCAVECAEYPRNVLVARQNDGSLEPFPIWDDVRTFDGKPWRGIVDVVSGGFPCQDISVAGRGEGLGGRRSSLWFEMLRIIGEVNPKYVFIENSPMLRKRGGMYVVRGLAELGYDAQWGIVSAKDCGAPHTRKRFWCVASNTAGFRRRTAPREAKSALGKEDEIWSGEEFDSILAFEKSQCAVASEDERMGYGIPRWMERLTAIGNAQVPQVARIAWHTLSQQPEGE